MHAVRTARLPADWRATPDALQDRVVLVTGASRRVGRATALGAAPHRVRASCCSDEKFHKLEKVYDAVAALQPCGATGHLSDGLPAPPRRITRISPSSIAKEFGRLRRHRPHRRSHFDSLRPAANIPTGRMAAFAARECRRRLSC